VHSSFSFAKYLIVGDALPEKRVESKNTAVKANIMPMLHRRSQEPKWKLGSIYEPPSMALGPAELTGSVQV
jgi:hypothetical protein